MLELVFYQTKKGIYFPMCEVETLSTYLDLHADFADALAPRRCHDPCIIPHAVPIVEAMAAIIVLE